MKTPIFNDLCHYGIGPLLIRQKVLIIIFKACNYFIINKRAFKRRRKKKQRFTLSQCSIVKRLQCIKLLIQVLVFTRAIWMCVCARLSVRSSVRAHRFPYRPGIFVSLVNATIEIIASEYRFLARLIRACDRVARAYGRRLLCSQLLIYWKQYIIADCKMSSSVERFFFFCFFLFPLFCASAYGHFSHASKWLILSKWMHSHTNAPHQALRSQCVAVIWKKRKNIEYGFCFRHHFETMDNSNGMQCGFVTACVTSLWSSMRFAGFIEINLKQCWPAEPNYT